jgi:hypothetical protein
LRGYPLRIMPNNRAGRMRQQDSRFTLHFPGCTSLEDAIRGGAFVRKLRVPATAKNRIRNELRGLGMHWDTLFPDLPSLAKQICHEAGLGPSSSPISPSYSRT